MTITVKEGTQDLASLARPVASPLRSVGIDFGLSTFATLSNGEKSETQAHYRQAEGRLKRLQRGCVCINDNLQLSDREWKCPNCGAEHDRDENGEVNIEMEGVSLLAGSGYIGETPVEFAASVLKFSSTQVADCEAGTFHVFLRER